MSVYKKNLHLLLMITEIMRKMKRRELETEKKQREERQASEKKICHYR